MRTLLLSIALTAVLCGAPVAGAAERVQVETAHYVVESSGEREEAENWGRMLEAAWPQFAAFFGKEPKLRRDERLRVRLFEDDAPWREAITAGGGNAPDAGGYYCPVARTAYVKRQPSAWYTRTLLLHEASHQFHYLARTGNSRPGANWYTEGVAEHLGSHTWDGETLHLGVLPLVSLEDRAGAALRSVGDDDVLRALVEAGDADRPTAMMLVRYLRSGDQRKAFDALARKMDRGTVPTAKNFSRAFGKPARLLPPWRAWLADHQEPLVSVFVEWDARGPDHVRGTAGVVSLCRTREPAQRIAAHVAPISEGGFRAGVVLYFADPRNYAVATVVRRPDAEATPRVQIDRLTDGKWSRLGAEAATAAGGGAWKMAAERDDAGVWFVVGDQRMGPFALPESPLGLCVDDCSADFREITITR